MRKDRPPNVTGRLLEEAREILARAGWGIAAVDLTQAPHRQDAEGGELRIARQRVVDRDVVALVVVQECRGKVWVSS